MNWRENQHFSQGFPWWPSDQDLGLSLPQGIKIPVELKATWVWPKQNTSSIISMFCMPIEYPRKNVRQFDFGILRRVLCCDWLVQVFAAIGLDEIVQEESTEEAEIIPTSDNPHLQGSTTGERAEKTDKMWQILVSREAKFWDLSCKVQ